MKLINKLNTNRVRWASKKQGTQKQVERAVEFSGPLGSEQFLSILLSFKKIEPYPVGATNAWITSLFQKFGSVQKVIMNDCNYDHVSLGLLYFMPTILIFIQRLFRQLNN